MGYDTAAKAYTRREFWSTGVEIGKSGTMGSDAGGWSMIQWECTLGARGGRTVRLKGATLMYSPVNYRLHLQISVDGGPYSNFGSPWFRKVEGPR